MSSGARVLVLENPRAGAAHRRDRVAALCRRLSDAGLRVNVVGTPSELGREAERALREADLRAVIAAGGDGTAAAAANVLPSEAPLAVLPCGTKNLLAKELGLGFAPHAVAAAVQGGRLRRWDAASANGRLFLVVASCGLDAEVVQRVHAQRQGNIRHLAYVWPTVATALSYSFPTLGVTLEDEPPRGGDRIVPSAPGRTPVGGTASSEIAPPSDRGKIVEQLEAHWLFLHNLPRYALNLPLARQASAADGRLDLVGLRSGSWGASLLRLGGLLWAGRPAGSAWTVRQVRRVRIECDAPVRFQVDGDPAGRLPLEIEVLPGRLTVIAPPLRREEDRRPAAARDKAPAPPAVSPAHREG